MRKLFIILSAILLIGSIAQKAHAFYVVDTGADPVIGVLINGNYGVAMQFSLGQAHTVTSIESMIYNWEDGTLSLAVFSDDTDFPNYSDELFRQDIFIPASDPAAHAWHGATGMDLDLDAGSYWVTWDSFSDPFLGIMSGGAVDPLDHYMFLFLDPEIDPTAYAQISGDPSVDLTLRIGALDEQVPAVPEPATMFLLGGGLAGAFLKRRRKV